MILLLYVLLFNLPVLLIVIYLLFHNHNAVKPEPIHFERKPLSYMLIVLLRNSVILCQDDEMYAIDEYFDEVESTPGINFSNVCFDLAVQ